MTNGYRDYITYTRVYTQKFVHGMTIYIQAMNRATINRQNGFLHML